MIAITKTPTLSIVITRVIPTSSTSTALTANKLDNTASISIRKRKGLSVHGLTMNVSCAACGYDGVVNRDDLLIQPILGFARGPHRRRCVDVWICDVCSEVWNQCDTKLNSLEATDQTESEKGN